jgi:hypothetical protein
MACVDALWRTFIEPKDARSDPTSMMVHASILRPRETGKIGSNPGFCQMHDSIQHDGIARHLDCWHVEIKKRNSAHLSLEHFAVSKPTWEHILMILHDLVHTYVASGSFRHKGTANECDEDLENSLIHNQYYLLYEEITYTMNYGDVGHIECVLGPWIAIFKGTGKTNMLLSF